MTSVFGPSVLFTGVAPTARAGGRGRAADLDDNRNQTNRPKLTQTKPRQPKTIRSNQPQPIQINPSQHKAIRTNQSTLRSTVSNAAQFRAIESTKANGAIYGHRRTPADSDAASDTPDLF